MRSVLVKYKPQLIIVSAILGLCFIVVGAFKPIAVVLFTWGQNNYGTGNIFVFIGILVLLFTVLGPAIRKYIESKVEKPK